MRETVTSAMPPCFERWCKRFDDVFQNKAQRKGFRHYLGGLLGESERKNLSQLAQSAVDVSYHRLRHFAVRAKWSEQELNERRLEVINSSRQTKIPRGFSLIVDDSGHWAKGPRYANEKVEISLTEWGGNTSEKLGKLIMG